MINSMWLIDYVQEAVLEGFIDVLRPTDAKIILEEPKNQSEPAKCSLVQINNCGANCLLLKIDGQTDNKFNLFKARSKVLDYLLFVENEKELTIIAIELKSKNDDGFEAQLKIGFHLSGLILEAVNNNLRHYRKNNQLNISNLIGKPIRFGGFLFSNKLFPKKKTEFHWDAPADSAKTITESIFSFKYIERACGKRNYQLNRLIEELDLYS